MTKKFKSKIPVTNRRVEVIRWYDANGRGARQEVWESEVTDQSFEIISVGFLVTEDDHHITVAEERLISSGNSESANHDRRFRGVHSIPKVNILSRRSGKVKT